MAISDRSAGPAAGAGDSFFAALMGALPEAAVVTDADRRVVYVNEAFTAMTGYTLAESRGRDCRFLQGPGTDRGTVASIREALAEGRPWRGRILNQRKDGAEFWNEIALAPIGNEAGRPVNHIALERDVSAGVADHAGLVGLLEQTEQHRATLGALLQTSRALAQELSTERLLRSVAASIPELCGATRSAVAVWDPDAARLHIAAHAGWPEHLADLLVGAVVSPSSSPELAEVVVRAEPVLVGPEPRSSWASSALERYEIDAFAAIPVHSSGELRGLLLAYWVGADAPDRLDEPLRERLLGLAGMVGVAIDNARLIEETNRLAAHDPLTGLPNRMGLEQRLAQALERAADRAGTAVIFCDIDGLKRTNDAFGHDAGDQVLVEVAARLRGALRPRDTVARVGGDEFVIVLDQVEGEDEVRAIVRRLEQALAAPLTIGARTVSTRISMGLAFSAQPLRDASPVAAGRALIKAADLAMYQQRTDGTTALSGSPLGRLQRLADDLPDAAARGELRVLYQPQLDLLTGECVAVEALVRWEHPALGAVLAAEFLPLAAMTGMIVEIGRSVLRQACRDLAELRARHPDLRLAVNVSPDELDADGFVAGIAGALADAGLPASALTLDITESKLPEGRSPTLSAVAEAAALGVGIALDDFGGGPISFARIRGIPVTELKLDLSLLEPPEPGRPDLAAGILGFARGLGVRTLAERVATPEDLARARTLGMDRAQGFALAAPMPFDELVRHLDADLVSPAR